MSCDRHVRALVVACGIGVIVCTAHATMQQDPTAAPTGLASRRTTTVTYDARRTTKVDLVGTPLMPRTRGEAEIKTEAAGPVRIKAKMRELTAASQFGAEYLVYVLWAIPPQGRAKNLGELRLDDGEVEIQATADVQTFALIVTAEPYYAVTTPSEVVVMENSVRPETRGQTSIATLQYEIVPRGAYIAAAGGKFSLPPPNKKEPPDVQQARNAVAIAQIAEAERFAASGFANARQLLLQTEDLVKKKASSRDIISQSRAAVQAAEEARLQSVGLRAREEERAVREAAAAREQAARDRAAQEEAARRAAEQERQRAEQQARQSAELRQQAEQAAQQAAQERALADEARREAERFRAEAEAAAARADELRVKAETDQKDLRATLLKQFNDILETRDTARGLIVNVGDVLFETGKYDLRPEAREKLARFAGIVLAHAGLSIQSEGFTDSTGTDAINERLSQQRADAVGDYLRSQGVTRERVTTRGYGATNPVASNDTREGRQQNRRVELVVTGDVIGTPIAVSR
jgi:outer membrane protein OmpA-like peptidoglycan-associated protein